MKASILSTIAACLLPAIAAPYEGAHDLAKRDCPSIFSMQLTIEDNSTYWLAPYRTRYSISGRRARIFPYDSKDEYSLNGTILQVVHTDYNDTNPDRYGFALPLSPSGLGLYFVSGVYFEENPDVAENSQDFVVATMDEACEVTLSFGGEQRYLHFPGKGFGAPHVTLRTDKDARENAHAVQKIMAVPVNW